jgi:hypothetical protein
MKVSEPSNLRPCACGSLDYWFECLEWCCMQCHPPLRQPVYRFRVPEQSPPVSELLRRTWRTPTTSHRSVPCLHSKGIHAGGPNRGRPRTTGSDGLSVRRIASRRLARLTADLARCLSMLPAFLTPVAFVQATLSIWRIGADMGWAAEFFVPNGLLSRWQVWMTLAISTQCLSVHLSHSSTTHPVTREQLSGYR